MNDYLLTLRPATIGTYPTRDAAGRDLRPTVIEDHWPPRRTPDNRNHYATVRYPEPLNFERIWRYDLLPVDQVEMAHYTFWLYADRDDARATESEAEWLGLGIDWLTRWVTDEPLGTAAVIILQAQQPQAQKA